MKSHARVVVIGGGAMGVGALYHLVREGWNDVVLCEKGELTSGSTWHAAGLVPHFIGDTNMARIHLHGSHLYASLEAETGQSTGWHGCGAIRLATNDDEVDWFHRVKGVLDYVGAECHLVGPDEIRRLHPLLDLDGVRLGFLTPNDGHTDPASSTNAMAIGARNGGAEIYRHTRVTDIRATSGGEWEVVTETRAGERGAITCEHVVNATGCFGPQVAAMVGLRVPIVNMVHQYLVTENLAEVEALGREPPVVRDPRASCYYRQEQQGLLIGPYEMEGAEAWGLDGVDWRFDMELLPPDLERLETSLTWASRRIPAFANAGIKRVVSGPITHTPDGNFLLGPAPGLRNHWLCVGASIGVCQGPGAGKYLAQWMVHGTTEINMLGFDPRRYGDWACGDYALERSIDEYQQMYQVPYPGEHREAGRPVRLSPIHERLATAGAVFGDAFGWERAKWFDPAGDGERYSFRRSNAFAEVADECRAVRERVGVLDLSSFAKFEVHGRDAASFLDRVCANRVPRRDGRVVLAHMLGEGGGIECETTVTRLDATRFYLLSAATAALHDRDWLEQHVVRDEDVVVDDVTDEYGCVLVAGPRARTLLSRLTDAGLGGNTHPWMAAREIEVAGIPVRALRVSYVGELGWELHAPADRLAALYDALFEAGADIDVSNFGTYAVNSLRMEKAYRAWGGELTVEVTPPEAGLDRFVALDKAFIGRDAVRARLESPALALVYLDIDAGDADALGDEPVHDGERIVGLTTAGAYGHAVRKSLAFAYVEPRYAEPGVELDVTILGERRIARVLAEPAYDPRDERLRA